MTLQRLNFSTSNVPDQVYPVRQSVAHTDSVMLVKQASSILEKDRLPTREQYRSTEHMRTDIHQVVAELRISYKN